MAKALDWQMVSLPALNAPFDARSVPADLIAGAFRWKQNFAINSTGRLSRRAGHARLRLSPPSTEDPLAGINDDYHDHALGGGADQSREFINRLYEHIAPDASKTLFSGSMSTLNYHDGSQWKRIGSELGGLIGGPAWSMASLDDTVIFTNNTEKPKKWKAGDPAVSDVEGLNAAGVKLTAARVVVQSNGHVIFMNVVEDGERIAYRVRWCRWSEMDSWSTTDDTTAGWQNLESGEEILACAPLQGSILIYTSKSIYRMYYIGSNGATDSNGNLFQTGPSFGFQRIYHEPKSRIGCLAYPNTLVNTGDCHRYMGRDGIYKWTPYLTEPEREDWIHASSAVIFNSRYSSVIDSELCEYPVAEAVFDDEGNAREILFSWPDKNGDPYNDHTLACNVQYKTCDYVDTGYTAFVNFNQKADCNSGSPTFIGASGQDWCLKQIGSVFYRETLVMPSGMLITNVTGEPHYTRDGYNTIIRGEVPTGWPSLEKTIRRVVVEHESVAQANPCKLQLRIANARMVRDCNIGSGLQAVQWANDLPEEDLQSPDERTVADLAANNLRPDYQTDFWPYRIGRHLYYEFTVKGSGGALAVGGQTEWSRIDFEVKPGA